MDFDLNAVRMVQFGVGRDDGDEHAFHCVMVDDGVQSALGEMAAATWDAMQKLTNEPVRYEPSEKLDSLKVHILRPSGFEFAGKPQDAILGAVAGNAEMLQADLPFVQFGGIQGYASTHPRAARYLASIRSQQEVARIDQQHLIEACSATGVKIADEDGQIVVDERNIMGFLEVLDRRRYEVRLVPDEPEQYRAPSRTRLR